jgi:hypothetical protein
MAKIPKARKSVKKDVLDALFEEFQYNKFSTDDIKVISKKFGFKNHFDVPKIDKIDNLSPKMVEYDLSLEKTGNGTYLFKAGGSMETYHNLEEISPEEIINMDFIPDILYGEITSENDVLNCIKAHGISTDFTGDDLADVYPMGRRQVNSIQIETDGVIYSRDSKLMRTCELKNQHGKSFNMNQLYNSYNYYKSSIVDTKSIFAQNKKISNMYIIQIFEYDFDNPNDIKTIKLSKKREYRLHI